jgi:hypothetical protein
MTREVGPERRDGPTGMPKEILIQKKQCPLEHYFGIFFQSYSRD